MELYTTLQWPFSCLAWHFLTAGQHNLSNQGIPEISKELSFSTLFERVVENAGYKMQMMPIYSLSIIKSVV